MGSRRVWRRSQLHNHLAQSQWVCQVRLLADTGEASPLRLSALMVEVSLALKLLARMVEASPLRLLARMVEPLLAPMVEASPLRLVARMVEELSAPLCFDAPSCYGQLAASF